MQTEEIKMGIQTALVRLDPHVYGGPGEYCKACENNHKQFQL